MIFGFEFRDREGNASNKCSSYRFIYIHMNITYDGQRQCANSIVLQLIHRFTTYTHAYTYIHMNSIFSHTRITLHTYSAVNGPTWGPLHARARALKMSGHMGPALRCPVQYTLSGSPERAGTSHCTYANLATTSSHDDWLEDVADKDTVALADALAPPDGSLLVDAQADAPFAEHDAADDPAPVTEATARVSHVAPISCCGHASYTYQATYMDPHYNGRNAGRDLHYTHT